jgi:hypothetical protein
MLGHGGLLHAKGFDDLSDRPFRADGQEVENLAPARLSHRIESIGGSRCSCHASQYIPLWEYVKRYFCWSKSLVFWGQIWGKFTASTVLV